MPNEVGAEGIKGMAAIPNVIGKQPPAARILSFSIGVLICMATITISLAVAGVRQVNYYLYSYVAVGAFSLVTLMIYVGYSVFEHLSSRSQVLAIKEQHDEVYRESKQRRSRPD